MPHVSRIVLDMKISIVPCLRDNYAYILVDPNTRDALIVDPSEGPPVLEAVKALQANPVAILNTHHHYDHVGGNNQIREAFPGILIIGHISDEERIPGFTRGVSDEEKLQIGSFSFDVIHNPGHTRGAVSYYFPDAEAVFTGDTLFTAGCGRLFEGTPQELYSSFQRLTSLPETTQVYCGHEYTVANLAFAETVEPKNKSVLERKRAAEDRRAKNLPTIPSLLSTELATNPFLRVQAPEVIASVSAQSGLRSNEPVALLGALRAWKDSF